MIAPVKIVPVVVTQGYHAGHEAVDLRNYDFTAGRARAHVAIESGTIHSAGVGRRYHENFIILHGSSGYYLYCHNVLQSGLAVGDSVDEGQDIGIPDLSGSRSTGYHLHFEHWLKLPVGTTYFRSNPLDLFRVNGIEWILK